MSDVDPSPRPGAAPYSRMVRAQAAMETRLLMRNGEQLLLAVVIPVIVLVGGVFAADQLSLDLKGDPVATLVPGVMALAIMSSAFTSLAIATGFERRYGVIKRLGASPLPRSGLLLGKAGALVTVLVLQLIVIGGVGALLGWRPELSGILPALVSAVLGTVAFASLGMLVAGVLRAEATLAAANLVYLLLMAGGAVILPSASYGAYGVVTRLLPSGALGDSMRAALVDGNADAISWLVLLAWAAVGTLLTVKTFKWE